MEILIALKIVDLHADLDWHKFVRDRRGCHFHEHSFRSTNQRLLHDTGNSESILFLFNCDTRSAVQET
jgi:hypothetical protein